MRNKSDNTVIYRETRSIISEETGELLHHEHTQKRKLSREPDFIKLYLDDIMMLSQIPKQKSDILYLLLKKINYENEIVIIGSIKRQIADDLKCSIPTVDKSLSMLVEKNVLIRKDRGVYIANPKLFGRGKWEDIEELRLSISYKRNGKQIKSEVEREKPELKEAR
jgi:Firmicute plasmid replication protein (RepL)